MDVSDNQSIYVGADVKLEAFDCFHKVLNKCNNGYHFSIHDAASLLKQLTPDILIKIVPLISQEACSPKKKAQAMKLAENKNDVYERGVDAEVSQINESQKDMISTSVNQSKILIKRPDASRPTRMLSPGSNSCSPVSAAVQALISISAPVTEKTTTQTTSFSNKTLTIVENIHKNEYDRNIENDITVDNMFVPVSKPDNNVPSDFLDSAFVQVPKASNPSSTQNNQYEIDEVLFTSRSNQNLTSSSSLINSHASTSINHSMASVLSQSMECEFTAEDKQNFESLKSTASNLMPPDDPLPNFGLLLTNAGLPGEMSCSIPFPFSQQLPGSPMQSAITTHQNVYLPNVSQGVSHHTQLVLPQQHESLNHITNVTTNTEMFPNEQNNMRQTFRTILPKPPADITAVVSVLPSTAVPSNLNDVGQLSQKMDDKIKNLHFSVPPNQIFTKLNMNNLSLSAVSQLMRQQQKTFNQNYLFTPSSESDIVTSNQDKTTIIDKNATLKHYTTSIPANNTKPINKLVSLNLTKQESGRGNLEVASALLSMGTRQAEDDENKIDTQSLLELVKLDLQKDTKNHIEVTLNHDGTLKIDDFDIDPTKNIIEKDNFTCGKCGRVFTSVVYLIRHIKRVCPDMSQRKWKCDQCAKAFSHPFGLQQHLFTHSGERPYKCDTCVKAFYSANDLRRHARTHTGERPYKCDVCQKTFSTTISLRTHSYTHTGERPHKCPHCVKSFSTSSKLSRHIVTHSDKRPFPCDQCEKKFNRSGDLRRHYKQHGLSHELLECTQCHKVFATKKCLMMHKEHHNPPLPVTTLTPEDNKMFI